MKTEKILMERIELDILGLLKQGKSMKDIATSLNIYRRDVKKVLCSHYGELHPYTISIFKPQKELTSKPPIINYLPTKYRLNSIVKELTNEQINELIIELHNNNIANRTIAKIIGTNESIVHNILKEAELTRKVITPKLKKLIREMKKQNLSKEDIAKQLGFSISSIRYILDKFSDVKEKNILLLLKQGKSIKDIAEVFDISQSYVSKVQYKHLEEIKVLN